MSGYLTLFYQLNKPGSCCQNLLAGLKPSPFGKVAGTGRTTGLELPSQPLASTRAGTSWTGRVSAGAFVLAQDLKAGSCSGRSLSNSWSGEGNPAACIYCRQSKVPAPTNLPNNHPWVCCPCPAPLPRWTPSATVVLSSHALQCQAVLLLSCAG